MVESTGRSRLVYRVAQAYYEENLTQAEIAARFGISRIKVSRLLTKARNDGVVRISVVMPEQSYSSLERQLEARFDLNEAVIAGGTGPEYELVIQAVGRAAAEYLSRIITNGEVIGLSWGTSILAAVNALPWTPLPDCRAVQLLGGLGLPESDIHGAELVRRVAQRLSCRPRHIQAPGIVPDRSVRDALLADPQVADTLELGRNADIAILGIGALGPHSILRSTNSILSADECKALLEIGVVGDVALRFFDADGTPVQTAYSDRTIGIELSDLIKIPRRVGIAGGSEKVAAIRAALSGRLVNVLVTDPATATQLLQ